MVLNRVKIIAKGLHGFDQSGRERVKEESCPLYPFLPRCYTVILIPFFIYYILYVGHT